MAVCTSAYVTRLPRLRSQNSFTNFSWKWILATRACWHHCGDTEVPFSCNLVPFKQACSSVEVLPPWQAIEQLPCTSSSLPEDAISTTSQKSECKVSQQPSYKIRTTVLETGMATKKYEDIGVSVCVIDTALVQRQASVATRSLLSPEQKQI